MVTFLSSVAPGSSQIQGSCFLMDTQTMIIASCALFNRQQLTESLLTQSAILALRVVKFD